MKYQARKTTSAYYDVCYMASSKLDVSGITTSTRSCTSLGLPTARLSMQSFTSTQMKIPCYSLQPPVNPCHWTTDHPQLDMDLAINHQPYLSVADWHTWASDPVLTFWGLAPVLLSNINHFSPYSNCSC